MAITGMMSSTHLNSAGSVRAVMADAMAKRQGCAVILVHPISKGVGGPRQRALDGTFQTRPFID